MEPIEDIKHAIEAIKERHRERIEAIKQAEHHPAIKDPIEAIKWERSRCLARIEAIKEVQRMRIKEDQTEDLEKDDASTSAGASDAPVSSSPEDEAPQPSHPATDPNAAARLQQTEVMHLSPRHFSEAPDTKEGVQASDEDALHQMKDAEGRRHVLSWLQEELAQVLEDQASAEALVACVEVILGDECAYDEEMLAQTMEMLIGEGVPQAVVDEFAQRVQ